MIIDGNLIAQAVRNETKSEVVKLGITPRLDVVLMGDNSASEIYVKKKIKACEEIGVFWCVHRPQTEAKLFSVLHEVNELKNNAVIVQLPLPNNFPISRVFEGIKPVKDVDVFHPENVGLLVQNRPRFLPPTPHAVHRLISHVTTLNSKHVVVINRSNIVGKPLSSMLIQDNGEYANSTVTVCHDQTPPEQLKSICLSADIIVVAVGIPNFLTPDMVTEKQVIIDVGINRLEDKIVGDVHPFVKDKVQWTTPVPGGVGPVTVAMLLHNTVEAFKLQC
jgi:methylenetetrahydrofolate dehydrogenase (NADP+) / methenyltetrahydrofolate cyclohydrolase